MRTDQSKTTSAFTLIQVLVVLSIVSVLAAILYPLIRWGKERALATKCSSNIKQVGMACLVYATENDQLLYPRMNFEFRSNPVDKLDEKKLWHRAGDPVGWHSAINQFAKSKEVFFCAKANTAVERDHVNPTEPEGSIVTTLTTYRTSIKHWLLSSSTNGFVGIRVDLLTNPSNELYLGEVNWMKPHPEDIAEGENPTITFHGDKMNLFFLDGSVRYRGMQDSRASTEASPGQ